MQSVEVFKCPHGRLFRDRDKAAHCKSCPICGESNGGDCSSKCSACLSADWKERERKWLDAAEDVSDTYDGPVFVGDEFYSDIDSAMEAFWEYDPDDRPEWAHSAIAESFSLDLQRIIENAEENHSGNCEEYEYSLQGVAELEEAVNKFNELNAHEIVYNVDYKRKVRLVYPAEDAGPGPY